MHVSPTIITTEETFFLYKKIANGKKNMCELNISREFERRERKNAITFTLDTSDNREKLSLLIVCERVIKMQNACKFKEKYRRFFV